MKVLLIIGIQSREAPSRNSAITAVELPIARITRKRADQIRAIESGDLQENHASARSRAGKGDGTFLLLSSPAANCS
jgi:hypothetical protein